MQHFTDGIVWNNIVGIGLWSLLLARSFPRVMDNGVAQVV